MLELVLKAALTSGALYRMIRVAAAAAKLVQLWESMKTIKCRKSILKTDGIITVLTRKLCF